MRNAALVPEHKITLDPDLVDNVARGSCVLFFGADHPAATPAPPPRRQLADALAERYPEWSVAMMWPTPAAVKMSS